MFLHKQRKQEGDIYGIRGIPIIFGIEASRCTSLPTLWSIQILFAE